MVRTAPPTHRRRLLARLAAGVTGLSMIAACGASSPKSLPVTTLPRATTTTPDAAPATASADCIAAFNEGEDDESSGVETFVAFRPSIQRCSSLGEWTAALRLHGSGLEGQEAVFVDRTCNEADDATRARPICQEVKGADR
jgi:hypothetical protein